MGLGPCSVRQMVDYPNKRTNYLGSPPVPGHCWEQQRPQQPDLPTVGQLAASAAHTLAMSHSFHSHFSLSTPTHSSSTWQSRTLHKQILEIFCFSASRLLCLGRYCSRISVKNDLMQTWFHPSLGCSVITVCWEMARVQLESIVGETKKTR